MIKILNFFTKTISVISLLVEVFMKVFGSVCMIYLLISKFAELLLVILDINLKRALLLNAKS